MKRFALLRLENNANKVIFDCEAATQQEAIKVFNRSLDNNSQLNKDGYKLIWENSSFGNVSLCAAEYFEPFHTVY